MSVASYNRAEWWLEVEGWPFAVGTFSASSSFFASRETAQEFDGIRPLVRRENGAVVAPTLSPSRIDHLAGRASTATARVSLVDVSGELHPLFGTLRYTDHARLAADVAYDATTWTLNGDVSGWASSGYAYCGQECVSFTRSGSTMTVVRGQRRTRALPHKGATSGGAVRGDIVTQYPRSVIGRRCWLRYWTTTSPTATPTDAGARTVFAGRLTDYAQDAHGGVTLDADDAQALLRTALGADWFRDQVADPSQPVTWVSVQPDDPESPTYNDGTTQVYPQRVLGLPVPVYGDMRESVHLTVGDEIVQVVPFEAGNASDWLLIKRGVLTQAPGTGDLGRSPASVTWIVGGNRAQAWSDYYYSDHPLFVLLAHLLSTGTRTVSSSGVITAGYNTYFDCLPRGWGLGIPQEDVDVSGITALALLTPDFAVTIPMWAGVEDFRAWACEQLLRPFGFYLATTGTGVLTVRAIRTPTVDQVVAARALTLADVVRDAGTGLPKIGEAKASDEAIIRSAKWADGPMLLAGPKLELPDAVPVAFVEDADFSSIHSVGESVEIGALGLHSNAVSGAGKIASGGMSGAQVRAAWQDTVSTRYQTPAVLFDVECVSSWLDVAPGDLISVTLPNVPNAASATRGLSAEVCEVWGVKADLTRGTVTLTLAQTGAIASGRRAIAPAVGITSRTGGTLSVDSADDRNSFAAGMKVRLYSADLSSRSSQATISSIGTTIVINDPGDLPATGVLMLDDYSGARVADVAKYAYRADNAELLGTAAPHVFAE